MIAFSLFQNITGDMFLENYTYTGGLVMIVSFKLESAQKTLRKIVQIFLIYISSTFSEQVTTTRSLSFLQGV